MKKTLSLFVAACFLLSMGSAHAWKKSKKRYAPRINPYAYNYANPYAQASPYGRYPQQAYRSQYPTSRNTFPMMGRQQMPWSQFGGSSFPSGFPMMNGFGSSPFSGMSPSGFGSPFSSMSPMSPMGFGSPFSMMSPMGFGSPFSMMSPMSPMGFGSSPFSSMSPFGSSMPFSSSPFANFGKQGRSRGGFMPF